MVSYLPLHCIEGAFMVSKRCRIVVEVLKHWEHKVVVFQDKDPFFFFQKTLEGIDIGFA